MTGDIMNQTSEVLTDAHIGSYEPFKYSIPSIIRLFSLSKSLPVLGAQRTPLTAQMVLFGKTMLAPRPIMGMPSLSRKDSEDTENPEKSLYQTMQQDSVKRVLAKSEEKRSLFQKFAIPRRE